MTLQNGLIYRRKAYLWTDTEYFCGETGRSLGTDTKNFYLHTWPAAGVLSFHGGNPLTIATAIGEQWPVDVDDLLAKAVDAVRAYCAAGGTGRALIATNLDGPRLFVIASDGAGLGPAFCPLELTHYTSSGNTSRAYQRALRLGMNPARMAKVIDAQIAEPFEGIGPLSRLGKRRWIGGEIVQMEVSATGVENRVIRTVDEAVAA